MNWKRNKYPATCRCGAKCEPGAGYMRLASGRGRRVTGHRVGVAYHVDQFWVVDCERCHAALCEEENEEF